MEKPIKLAVSIYICGLILLSGCGTASGTSLPSELRTPNTDYPNTVNIFAPDFFHSDYAEIADQMKQQWLDEMSQRYGVTLNIVSDYNKDSENSDRSAFGQVYDVLEGKTTFDGFVSVRSNSLIVGTFYDTLLPLEDYLADNPTWNALPDDFKSLFEADGHIYAIPGYFFRAQNARYIYKDALNKTGITVTDLDSFQKFAIAYKQATGNAALGCVRTTGLEDILNAFGLYPYRSEPFGYDPMEDCFVDMLTKDAAVDALEYLRKLYKAGALDFSLTDDVGYKNFTGGLYASHYHQYSENENCTEVFTLNPEYPQIAITDMSCFAMTKDTSQPKEKINLLVDMLFGSELNYLDCWLGSSENYTLNSDGTITVEMPQDSEGNFVYPCMPYLTGGFSDIFPHSDANLFFSQNGVVTAQSKAAAEEYNAHFKQLYDSLKNGSVAEIPPQYQNIKSATYDANENFVARWYFDCIKNAITGSDRTVQQIVEDYRTDMLNLGGNAMLDEMNAAVGKKTAYYYG